MLFLREYRRINSMYYNNCYPPLPVINVFYAAIITRLLYKDMYWLFFSRYFSSIWYKLRSDVLLNEDDDGDMMTASIVSGVEQLVNK